MNNTINYSYQLVLQGVLNEVMYNTTCHRDFDQESLEF